MDGNHLLVGRFACMRSPDTYPSLVCASRTMQLRTIRSGEDRAVSPVIGVILMVAITVILAAVIGTFVLGLGDNIGGDDAQASLSFNQDDDTVHVSHQGGDNLSGQAVVVGEAVDEESGNENSPSFTEQEARIALT
jgi:flagellin-like protein